MGDLLAVDLAQIMAEQGQPDKVITGEMARPRKRVVVAGREALVEQP